ncbi:MAG TPA: Clp protease N-terminal domain-containing protein [Actinomycetota bacterium]|nr:Clp protease N-terminal domain-containing protein [Actinomycetota bacterium]
MSGHLVGVAEIARLLGVSRQRVAQLSAAYPDFPRPEAELASGRVWSAESIEAWLATHPERKPGRREGEAFMFERLTDRARRAFVLAQEEARSRGHTYVGCEHLLLGLLAEEEGIAAHALIACGLTLPAARAALDRIIPGAGPVDTPVDTLRLPFTPRVTHALDQAQEAALELGHADIGTEHILLGIIREGENVGCRLLVEAGLGLQAVRLNVLQQMGFPQARSAPGQDRRLNRVLDKLTEQLADIDARLERLEQQLT